MIFSLPQELLLVRLSQNSIQDYFKALTAFVVTFTIMKFIEYFLLKRMEKWIGKTKTKVDDFLIQSFTAMGEGFYFLLALNAGLQFIVVPEWMRNAVYYATLIGFVYYVAKALQKVVEYLIKKSAQEKDRDVDSSLINILTNLVTVFLWIIAVLLILSNLGYNISSLLTGLGVGGIAVGFALQSILEDLFSAFSIYFDKPFKTGDTIVFGEDRGKVRKIGIKSTRVKTLKGDELIVPNKELTSSVVHNYRRMEKRRVAFTLGVGCDTSVEQLRKIPDMTKNIINNVNLASFDRAHFVEFGDFSFNFYVIYYIDSPDFRTYRQIQHEINLGILDKFNKENIAIPYPTQSVLVKRSSGEI